MRFLLFTAASRRHHALAEQLATLGNVDVVGEVPPERVIQGPAMAECYRRMDEAESAVFGDYTSGLAWIKGVSLIQATNMGAVSAWAGDLAPYDAVIVYGSSWIRPPLVNRLIAKGAVNLHAGMAPWYRGTACNFWAVYDEHPEYVGTTLHRLSDGIDAGPVLGWTSMPKGPDPWFRGMRTIHDGQMALMAWLIHGDRAAPGVPQERYREIRYSRAADYTEAVCQAYLEREVTACQQ